MIWLNIPPVWLLAFLAASWGIGKAGWLRLDLAFVATIGAAIAVLGVALMALALLEMWKARTTPIPHKEPEHLVTTGIFGFSRNPIYLGDAAVLAGLILYWDAIPALPLVPIFLSAITKLFIRPGEARLAGKFGPDFDEYREKVRRWL